jgi:hypothetical protein
MQLQAGEALPENVSVQEQRECKSVEAPAAIQPATVCKAEISLRHIVFLRHQRRQSSSLCKFVFTILAAVNS